MAEETKRKRGNPNLQINPILNPAGRPKGSKSKKLQVAKVFSDILEEPSSPKSQKTNLFAFVETIVKGALKGNNTDKKILADWLKGNSTDLLEYLDVHESKIFKDDIEFPKYKIFRRAFDIQQEVLLSHKRRIYMMCGRRSGKTITNAMKIVEKLIDPDSRVLYVGLSIKSALYQMWNEVKTLIKEIGLEITEERRNEGTIILSNGSYLALKGNNDKREQEKMRGYFWDLIIVDEVQSQPYLKELLDDVLEPELIDRKGTLILSGTGPLIRASYWEELWQHEDPNTLKKNWNILSNPIIEDALEELNRIKQAKGWTDKSAQYVREYLGQIAYDDEALIFELKDNNFYTIEDFDRWVNEHQSIKNIRFIGGIDYGFRDYNAVAIIAFSLEKKEKFLLYEYKINNASLETFGEHIKNGIEQVKTKLPQFKGLDININFMADHNPQNSFDLSKNFDLTIIPAEKHDKNLSFSIAETEVRTGNLKVPKGSIFEEEASKTLWERDNKGNITRTISSVYHPDLIDALLYALRTVTKEPKIEKPKYVPLTPDNFSINNSMNNDTTFFSIEETLRRYD